MHTTRISRHHFEEITPPRGLIRRPRHYIWLYRKRNQLRQVGCANKRIMLLPTDWFLQTSKVINFKRSVLHASDHTVTLVNEHDTLVARVSYSRAGNYKIRASIASFESASLLPRPKLLQKSPTNIRYLWHTETYVEGARIEKTDRSPLHVAAKTYASHVKARSVSFADIEASLALWRAALQPIYKRRFETFTQAAKKRYGKKTTLLVAPIHGDLTYRNCLKTTDGFQFIDWDRHTTMPPELDLILYEVDQYVQSQATIKGYTDYIDRFNDTQAIKAQLNDFYTKYPQLSLNEKNYAQIHCLLIYRFTLLSIVNTTHPSSHAAGLALIDAAESSLT